MAWDPKYLRHLGFEGLVSSDNAHEDEIVVLEEDGGSLWDDLIAWVVQDSSWLLFNSSDKVKAKEKMRSVYYIAPGCKEESPIKILIMGQGKNFNAQWQNSIDNGILEENAVLKYLTRRGKLVRVGSRVYIKDIQNTNTAEVVPTSHSGRSAECASQSSGQTKVEGASITGATDHIGILDHANATGGGQGDDAAGFGAIHSVKVCEKSKEVGVLRGCGGPRKLTDMGVSHARGRSPQSSERRGLDVTVVPETCLYCLKDFSRWSTCSRTKQALIKRHYQLCGPKTLDTEGRRALEAQQQSNEGSQQVLDSNVGPPTDLMLDNLSLASDMVGNSNADRGLQSGENSPSGDDDGEHDDGGDGGDNGGGHIDDDRRHHSSDDNDASDSDSFIIDDAANDYDLVRFRVLVKEDESKELELAAALKLYGSFKQENGVLTVDISVFSGRKYEITAEALMMPGARFENLSQSIGNNPAISKNGEALIALFKLPVHDGDRRVPVKMRIPDAAEVCDCVIVFKVTAPLRYAHPERILRPEKQTIVFNLEVQPLNCEAQSQARMGEFSIIPKDLSESFVSNLDLDPQSGKLTVRLPRAVNLFKGRMSEEDSSEKTLELFIEQKNKMGERTMHVFGFERVKFAFSNIPDELIKGQNITGPISLTSVPNILTQLQVFITDLGSLPGGFEICERSFGSKLEITGAPNVESDAKVHVLTISCNGLAGIPVKLALPQIKIRETPLLQKPHPGRVTIFSLDKTLLHIKGAAKDFQFEENLMDAEHKKLFTMGSEGCSAQLTLVMGVETVVQIDYVSDKLRALESVNVEIRRFVHAKKEWVPQKNVKDFCITVKDGNLVIGGTPQAHTDEKDLLIDESAQRCRIFNVKITPQNQAGNGKILSLTIICRPLKIFFGVAQTYVSIKIPISDRLECCRVDLTKMIEVQRLLGCDISLTSCDATRGQIDCQSRDLHTIALSSPLDLLVYFTGHGQQRFQDADGYKTDMLLRHEDFSANWESVPHNLCIEDFAEEILKFTDDSSFPVVFADICRSNSEGSDTKGPPTHLTFNLTFKSLMKQIVIWWSTSAGLTAMAATSGQNVMSMWTGIVVQVLLELHEGKLPDLLLTQDQYHNQYIPGISAVVKARVHRLVSERVQKECKKKKYNADTQAPEHREIKVREAFSFQSPSFPPLPADLCALMPIDLRWSRLLEDKLLLEGDCILYVDEEGGELIGYVQGDGSIKHTLRSKHTSYKDAVAFVTGDNMWMSLDQHHQGTIDTNAKLFACCHLRACDKGHQMVSLEKLSTRLAPASAKGAQGFQDSGKGKENDRPHNSKVGQNLSGAPMALSKKHNRQERSLACSKQPKVK